MGFCFFGGLEDFVVVDFVDVVFVDVVFVAHIGDDENAQTVEVHVAG